MNDTLVQLGAVLGLGLLAFALAYGEPRPPAAAGAHAYGDANVHEGLHDEEVLPSAGVELPVVWGDLGAQLIAVGAIDEEKWRGLYRSRGPNGGALSAEEEKLLTGMSEGRLKVTRENSGYLLNLLWALGLANENPILFDTKEMMNPEYGGAGNFASTGGWTLAKGDAMDHYGKYKLISLTREQQEIVDRVSRNIYRPCCGNSTHFPDCNHGIGMLAFIELAASQGVSEEDLYRAALVLNSYWFPQTYLTIAAYKHTQGVAWADVSPKEVLGYDYSSARGYINIAAQVAPQQGLAGGGCSA